MNKAKSMSISSVQLSCCYFFICNMCVKVVYCNISKVLPVQKLSKREKLELHEQIFSCRRCMISVSSFSSVFRQGIDLGFVLPSGTAIGHWVPGDWQSCWRDTGRLSGSSAAAFPFFLKDHSAGFCLYSPSHHKLHIHSIQQKSYKP